MRSSGGAVTSSLTMSSLTFSSINSQNVDYGVYVNQEECSSNTNYQHTLSLSSLTFTSISNGGAIVLRDYNNFAKNQYLYTATLNALSLSTFTSAFGVHLIKDKIESDGTYSSDITLNGKSNFTSITTENSNTAVLIQESFIDTVSTFRSDITIDEATFSTIKAGPSVFVVYNEISSSGSSVYNNIDI